MGEPFSLEHTVVMGFSITIFTLYLPIMIAVIVLIKGKAQLPAATVMGAYLFSFTVKASSDTLRVMSSQNHIRLMQALSLLSAAADRINVFTVIYLSLIVNEVKIKLEASSIAEYKEALRRFRGLKKWVFATYAGLVIPIFSIYLARYLINSPGNKKTLAWCEISLKTLFIAFDAYLVYRFIILVQFFARQKKNKVRGRGSK